MKKEVFILLLIYGVGILIGYMALRVNIIALFIISMCNGIGLVALSVHTKIGGNL